MDWWKYQGNVDEACPRCINFNYQGMNWLKYQGNTDGKYQAVLIK